MRLYLAQPGQFAEHQREIRSIGNRVNDPDLFERIFEDLCKGRAFMFRSKSDPFLVVLKPMRGPGVLAWVALSTGKVDWRRYVIEIDILARKIGVRFIEFLTVRSGFDKKMPALGFKPHPSTWNGVPVTRWRKEYV